MEKTIQKENSDIYRREVLEIFCPYKDLSEIFNTAEFDVIDVGFREDKKVFLIVRKEIK